MCPDQLPASVAFCDVETTGLSNHDRIVNLGGIGMISRNLGKGRPELAYVYLVFNPGTGNDCVAERIHGFSDSTLRLQDPFAVHAADIRCFLASYELFVAHNVASDLRFINRELRLPRPTRGPSVPTFVKRADKFFKRLTFVTMDGRRAAQILPPGRGRSRACCSPHNFRWSSLRGSYSLRPG